MHCWNSKFDKVQSGRKPAEAFIFEIEKSYYAKGCRDSAWAELGFVAPRKQSQFEKTLFCGLTHTLTATSLCYFAHFHIFIITISGSLEHLWHDMAGGWEVMQKSSPALLPQLGSSLPSQVPQPNLGKQVRWGT